MNGEKANKRALGFALKIELFQNEFQKTKTEILIIFGTRNFFASWTFIKIIHYIAGITSIQP
jgi:hypothetical protein